jgi:hypothetical protein
VQEDGSFLPVFEGQRPPFERGNTVAVKHGAHSLQRLGPRVDELAAVIRDLVPTYGPADEIAVRQLALALSRIEAAASALEEAAPGAAPSLETAVRGWSHLVERQLAALGMNPASRARLRLDLMLGESAAQRALEHHIDANYSGEGGS